ncbi:GMP reductase 2 [Xenoophorus captivus]|uniref:GMP reductase n=1 Tax=Xenoophorus captivus TaxID=1517983 RepID=A0ABV0QCW9_9TELE
MPRIENDIKLDFKDVLLRPKRSTLKSRSELKSLVILSPSSFVSRIKLLRTEILFCSLLQVDLMRSFTFRNSKGSYRGIPIIAANMDTVGTFEMALALHQSVAVSTGTGDGDFEKISAIVEALPQLKYICVDVANGYSEHFVHFVKDVRQKFPLHTIMVREMVEELILAGADIIKVGIGPDVSGSVSSSPGSVCTTRKKTGVGYPQLSAVIECADAAHGLGGHIISVSAGADFVMLGGMLAGHSESGGETIEKNGKKYKLFYGMSSDTAMKKHTGGVADYRASEGKTVEVSFKGPVDETIRDVLGGVRSTCTYVGAGKLKELSRRTTFIRVTQQLNTVFGNC